jgi:ATP synthase protein I
MAQYQFSTARRLAWLMILGQSLITALVALGCWLLAGPHVALSALAGGGIGTAATLAQVAMAFRFGDGAEPKAIVRGFYRGEALKVLVTLALFVTALRSGRFVGGGMLIGYVATFIVYWLALARKAPPVAKSPAGPVGP